MISIMSLVMNNNVFNKSKEMERNYEQIITQKMKREIIIDNVTEKKYCKKNKYDRWLTNDIILKISKDKLYIYVPKIYEKYFYNK